MANSAQENQKLVEDKVKEQQQAGNPWVAGIDEEAKEIADARIEMQGL